MQDVQVICGQALRPADDPKAPSTLFHPDGDPPCRFARFPVNLKKEDNARVEQCPGGASVRTPGSPRSGAEGESGVSCSTRAFPPERSGGGNKAIHIRKTSRPESYQKLIYQALGIAEVPGRTVKTML